MGEVKRRRDWEHTLLELKAIPTHGQCLADTLGVPIQVGDCLEDYGFQSAQRVLDIQHLDYKTVLVLSSTLYARTFVARYGGQSRLLEAVSNKLSTRLRRRCGDPCPHFFECMTHGVEVHLG